MDATLAFLYSAAVTKGPAHKCIENNALLLHNLLLQRAHFTSTPNKIVWDPQRPAEATNLAEKQVAKRAKEGDRKTRIEEAIKAEWALREARMMAEGMSGTILGRKALNLVPPSRKPSRNSSSR